MIEQNAIEDEQVDERATLLLVDDDPLITESLGFLLQKHYKVLIADSRHAAIDLLSSHYQAPELALVDLGLPPRAHSPEEGYALISDLLTHDNRIKILVLSGQDDDINIQHALTLGAVDFITKPAMPALLLSRLEHHHRISKIEQQGAAKNTFHIIGDSIAMDTVHKQIKQFADSPFPVLVEGESGTGKELIAYAIHQQRFDKEMPYVAINCAAFAADLLESQLFGHKKGSFTGATEHHDGFFTTVGKGTLLLDEVGELPLSLQVKLLRVLECGEFYKVGDTTMQKSAARIIAATNKDLSEEVMSGNFRTDLYHRLSILNIMLPPLRDRASDCYLLLNHFQEEYADSVAPFRLEDDALRLWGEYDFPGNIRELRNIVIRLGTKYPGQQITSEQLEAELETRISSDLPDSNVVISFSDNQIIQQMYAGDFYLDKIIDDIESRYIRLALEMNNNNISRAAEALHINRTTLYSRVQKLGRG